MSSPRLLWVTSESPDRRQSGGSIRQSHLLEGVAGRMTVDVLSVGGVDEPCRRLVRDVEALPEPTSRPGLRIPGPVRAIWDTQALRMTAPVADTRPHRKLLAPRLRARARDYELVHLEHDRLAPLAQEIRTSRRSITLHNLSSEQAAHRLAQGGSAPRRWLSEREGAVATAFERQVVRDFDRVFVTSEVDAEALGSEAVVVPNGVDVAAIQPAALPNDPRIVFTGRLDWQPNVEGLEWFCRGVLPRIQARLRRAHLDIVGFNPVPDVYALEGPGVEIHADVPSTLPLLHAARVAVVPLHVGSGTRLKALEAMAAGRPTVGTRIGLAGLHLRTGVQAEIVDDPDAMAAAVVHLLTDNSAANAMAAAARQHVEDHFDWRNISERFAETLLGLAEEKPS
jgi:glycosyltransferase involved in cell wall biosynthesis